MILDALFHDWLSRKTDLMDQGLQAGRAVGDLLHDSKGIVLAGMGGSGAAGRLVRDAVQDDLPVPLVLVQDDDLPGYVSKDWTVLALSYSGDTEETLAVARAAAARDAQVIGFTTGGRLAQEAEALVQQPTGYVPRAALAFMWMSILGVLEKSDLIGTVPLQSATAAVTTIDALCTPETETAKNPARSLAQALQKRIPCIYGTPRLQGVTRFMAALLNENAKRIAFHQTIPESNHNDLVGWSSDRLRRGMAAIVFHDADAGPEMQTRLDYMRERYAEWGVPWHDQAIGPMTSMEERIIQQAGCIQYAEYVSLYLAGAAGVDPAKIPPIDGLKRALRGQTPDREPEQEKIATTRAF